MFILCRFDEAEQDCSAALALDVTYSKAFARRATARAALGKMREAIEGLLILQLCHMSVSCMWWIIHVCFVTDYEQLLKLEPGNKQAITEIHKLTAVQQHNINQFTERRVFDFISTFDWHSVCVCVSGVKVEQLSGYRAEENHPAHQQTWTSQINCESHTHTHTQSYCV